MTYPSLPQERVERHIPRLASLVVFGIAGLAALGRLCDLPALTGAVADLPPMRPVTILTLLLAGLSLRFACVADSPRAAWLSRAAAILVLLIATVYGLSYLIDPAIDPLNRVTVFHTHPISLHVLRMSPHSALTFLLSGSALLLARINPPQRTPPSQILAAMAGCIVLLVLIGYLYHVSRLYSVDAQTGMSLPAALALAALNLGILMLNPDRGITCRVFSRSSGGAMLRQLWPAAIAIPVGLGWLRLWGEAVGLLNNHVFAVALMVTATITLLTGLIWRNAQSLDQQDAALRLERERLAVTLTSIGDAVIATDNAMRITFMNPIAETLTGWRQPQALGRDLAEVFRIVDETTEQPLENPVAKALNSVHGQPFSPHACLISRDGRRWPIDDSNAPIRDESGRVIGAVLVFREILERRHTEQALQDLHASLAQQVLDRTQALQASKELYRRTLQALPAHIAVIDRDGTIMAVNQAWSEFADTQSGGKAAPDVDVGANYLDVCRRAAAAGDRDAAQALADIEAVLSGAAPFHSMEYPCPSPERAYWFHMTVVPLDRDGEGGAVISHLDITDRKQAEQLIENQLEELRAANDDLERFNRLAIGRELRLVQLKEEINALSRQLGQPTPYPAADRPQALAPDGST